MVDLIHQQCDIIVQYGLQLRYVRDSMQAQLREGKPATESMAEWQKKLCILGMQRFAEVKRQRSTELMRQLQERVPSMSILDAQYVGRLSHMEYLALVISTQRATTSLHHLMSVWRAQLHQTVTVTNKKLPDGHMWQHLLAASLQGEVELGECQNHLILHPFSCTHECHTQLYSLLVSRCCIAGDAIPLLLNWDGVQNFDTSQMMEVVLSMMNSLVVDVLYAVLYTYGKPFSSLLRLPAPGTCSHTPILTLTPVCSSTCMQLTMGGCEQDWIS